MEQIQVSQKALESLDGSDLQRQLNNAQSELNVYQSEKESAQSSADSTQQSINDINQQLQQLTESKHQYELEVEAEYKDRQTEAEFNASRLNAERNAKSREITRIENIKDICPTCGQKLPDVHKPDTTELRAELAQIETNYNRAEKTRIAIMQEKTAKVNIAASEFSSKKLELTTILAENVKLSEGYRRAVRDVDLKINLANSKISELQRLLAQLETTIQNYQQTIENNSIKIRELDEKIMYNNSEKDLQQTHLDVVNKFETALKRDFRGFLLSTIIEYIQQRAKIYSEVIFETDKVGFCLDGNNIDITYLDKAYENLSGGEKQKIDLIIQFSIRDMLCNHLGFTSNILVLDEVFDGLDMIGCQRVLDVISNLTDIKNIFIVTHRKDLSIPTDKEIVVVKSSSGISEIR